jgi:diadenosine tetraphosphate (Ap4A) HIT family hydrolase
MSQWADPVAWARLCSGEACVICRQGAPNDILAELETSWVTVNTVNEDAPMRGYTCLVLRRHVELHDLGETEGAAFMRDVRRLSAAVQEVTGAVKLNYAVSGNTIPHVHMHFHPRYRGDPFEAGPIDARAVRRPVCAPGEFAALRARLREALGRCD